MQSKEKVRWNFLQHTCPKLYPGIVTKQFITFTHTIHVPILIYTVYYKHVPMFSSHTLEINSLPVERLPDKGVLLLYRSYLLF